MFLKPKSILFLVICNFPLFNTEIFPKFYLLFSVLYYLFRTLAITQQYSNLNGIFFLSQLTLARNLKRNIIRPGLEPVASLMISNLLLPEFTKFTNLIFVKTWHYYLVSLTYYNSTQTIKSSILFVILRETAIFQQ